MKTKEERIHQLHKRACEIRKKEEKIRITGLGGLSTVLLVLLVTCVIRMSEAFHSTMGVSLQGASLLRDSAGGYVMAAVIAFFAGVIITAVILKYRK